MAELSKRVVSRKVLNLVTGGVEPLRLQAKWDDHAHRYLQQCLRLYESIESGSEDQLRVDHLHSFFKVLQVLASKDPKQLERNKLLQDDWLEMANNLDHDALVVAFQILSQSDQGYLPAMRSYLCEKLKGLFVNAENLESVDWQNSKLKATIARLSNPVVLTMVEMRSLVQFVRSLQNDGHNRTEDVRNLLILWQKSFETTTTDKTEIKEFTEAVKAILQLVECVSSDFVSVAFDIIQLFAKSEDYRNTCTSRLANICVNEVKYSQGAPVCPVVNLFRSLAARINRVADGDVDRGLLRFRQYVVAELRNAYGTTDTANERKRVVEILLEVFKDQPGKKGVSEHQECLKVLKDVGVTVNCDPQIWRKTLFEVSNTGVPTDKVKKYLYALLYNLTKLDETSSIVHRKSKTAEYLKILTDASKVTEECKSRSFYDQVYIDILFNRFVKSIDTNRPATEDCLEYIQRALLLSNIYSESDKWRRAAEKMSRYRVMTALDKNANYHVLHAKIVLRLLQSSAYGHGEMNTTVRRDIKELLNGDTLSSPVGLPNQPENKIKRQTESNFKICRDVMNILDSSAETGSAQSRATKSRAPRNNKSVEPTGTTGIESRRLRKTSRYNKYGERTGMTKDEFERLRKGRS